MISSIIDAVLLSALAATSACVLLMYRRLRRFDVLQGEAARAFVRSSQALENARAALDALHEQSGEMAVSLAARLNEARLVLNELESGTSACGAATARRGVSAAAKPARTPAPGAHWRPDPDDGELDMDAWADRFARLQAAAEAKRQRSHATARDTAGPAGAGPPAARYPMPVAPGQELALAWRALNEAAHHTH